MAYNRRQFEALRRLGIEQLPEIPMASGSALTSDSSEAEYPRCIDLPIHTMPVPGRRCPACLSRGQTVWVIPGKYCPQCGTEVL